MSLDLKTLLVEKVSELSLNYDSLLLFRAGLTVFIPVFS